MSVTQEEDDMERLSQAQDLQDEEGGDNTEPLDDMFLGLSVDEHHTNHSTHGSMHSLENEVVASGPHRDSLRRVQSTDSLGSSPGAPPGLGGYNHKAKSASHLDSESDFGPLVGADCGASDGFGDSLSVKNAGRKLGRRCDMCSNYEKQLQVIQGQEAETRDQVLALVQRVQESESLLAALQQAFSQAKRNTQDQMAVLMQSREQVAEELSRLQRDNDSLKGKHRLHSELQLQEGFSMPATVHAVVTARTALDHKEERLMAEVLFLKEQIQAEQGMKEKLEETLQLEIESCKEEIASCSSLKTELERVKREREEFQRSLEEKTHNLDRLQSLSSSLDGQLREVTSTKTELDVSEQVQKDFVKLSQTLQLERIRQADCLDRIRVILNDTNLTDINQLPDT
ncbi:hypothetical protein CRUP_000693 [Coryphaenoides rupestris]|nr:hypothetical protein CRUP_000693 [Coryphaenoides rupestris]